MATEDQDSAEGDTFCVVVAILITFVFGIIAYNVFSGWAVDHYQNTHDMGTCVQNGWFGRQYQVACQADSSNLSWPTYLATVALPAIVYIIAHPIIGRVAVEIWNALGAELAETIGLQSDYFEVSAPIDKIAGSLWPVFLMLIPLELIGLLISKVYRSVW
jgi:hypothetical protein